MSINSNELPRLASLVFGHGKAQILSAEAELDLIRQVQAGDDDAFWSLCAGYVRALRSLMKGFRAEPSLGLEEAREELLIAFCEQVLKYDTEQPEKRLAYGIRRAKDRLNTVRHSRAHAADVSLSTVYRYRKHMQKHDNDFKKALEDVKSSGIDEKTFRGAHSVINREVLEEVAEPSYGPTAESSYTDYAQIALAAIADDAEACEVIERIYYFDDPELGFDADRPRSQAEVALLTGLSPSKVGRIHARALDAMRVALGMDLGEERAA